MFFVGASLHYDSWRKRMGIERRGVEGRRATQEREASALIER